MKPITTSAAVQEEQTKALMTGDKKLEIIESEIEEFLSVRAKSWREIGARLTIVRDEKLYRKDDASFESYCNRRWKISRQYAYEIIAASKVASNCQELLTFPSVNSTVSMGAFSEKDQKTIAEDLAKSNEPPTHENINAKAESKKLTPKSKPKPKTKVTVEPPKPSPSKAEKENLSKIAALEAQLETLQRGSMFANKIRSDIANLKASASNVSEAEIVAPPEDDARRDEDPLPFHAPSQKQALLDEMALVLQAFLHPNSSHNPGTVRALVSRFIELVNKHF